MIHRLELRCGYQVAVRSLARNNMSSRAALRRYIGHWQDRRWWTASTRRGRPAQEWNDLRAGSELSLGYSRRLRCGTRSPVAAHGQLLL